LTACSGSSSTRPDTPHTYLLEAPLPTLPQTIPPKAGKTLLISMPQAAPGFDTAVLIYTRTPYLLEHYSHNQWVDTPARMLLPLLVRRLEATGLFAAVLSATTSAVSGELRLDTEIIRLQQELSSQPSYVRLIIRAQLLDMVSRQVTATKTFEIIENVPREDPEGSVLATNQAVTHLLEQLATYLERVISQGS
jgi:cholesterol transport system auxiliary component